MMDDVYRSFFEVMMEICIATNLMGWGKVLVILEEKRWEYVRKRIFVHKFAYCIAFFLAHKIYNLLRGERERRKIGSCIHSRIALIVNRAMW